MPLCVQCYRIIRPGAPEYLVRIGRDRKKYQGDRSADYVVFGSALYGLACSVACAAKKDPVEWGDAVHGAT